jgi:hypothetical protein
MSARLAATSGNAPAKNDPVFALIDTHRASIAANNALPEDQDIPPDLAAVELDAMNALQTAEPASIAGAVAVLRYVVDRGEFDHAANHFLSTIANALDKMAAGSRA